MSGLSWDDLNPKSSAANHTHPLADIGMDTPSLVQLAEALGGGIYPGMGSGQNDTMPNQDSVAPGFPLQLFFVVPSNQVKQQAVKLSFQPSPYRNPNTSTATGPGDAHGHGGDTVATLSITINNENAGHHHSLQLKHALSADEAPGYNRSNDLFTTSDSADHFTATLNDNDGGHPGGDHSHNNVAHSHTPGTTGNEATHTHPTTTGFSNGTNPDNMGLIVDGTDVTSQAGGPWNSPQTDMDISPYVAPGTGIHLVQLTTQTNVGRIYGWVRQKGIMNNLGPLA